MITKSMIINGFGKACLINICYISLKEDHINELYYNDLFYLDKGEIIDDLGDEKCEY